jgi:hypothetical protein
MNYDVTYVSGLAKFSSKTSLKISIDPQKRKLYFSNNSKVEAIPFDKLLDVSFNEHYKRSAGKAAAGAIIGGVLTGGLGLIAGAAFGGSRKGDHTLFITYAVGNLEQKVTLKGSNLNQVQSSIISSIQQATELNQSLIPTLSDAEDEKMVSEDEKVKKHFEENPPDQKSVLFGCLAILIIIIGGAMLISYLSK